MDICILSMQQIDNYGSVLQAYALKKSIEQLTNNNVYFIDIVNGNKISLEDNQIFDYKSNSGIKIHKIIEKLKNKYRRVKFHKVFVKFRRDSLQINRKKDNKRYYNLCIIGSDEVFNCLQKSYWGFTSQLYGDVKNAKHVITYAASCGNTKENQLSINLKEEIKKALKNVEAFSVRDNNSYDFIYKLIGEKSEIHYDPVLIYDFSKEIECSIINKKLPINYCVIYSYENRINDLETIESIKKFCKKNKLEVITVFGRQRWVNKHYYFSPFEMLNVIKNSKFVITDTFHGTIFSAKYAPKVGIIIRKSNENKLFDLINRLDLNKHVISKNNTIDNIYNLNIDKEIIKKRTADYNNKFEKYIKYNIDYIGKKNG